MTPPGPWSGGASRADAARLISPWQDETQREKTTMSKFYYASLAVSGISADQWRTPEARLSRWGASYDRPGYATTLVSDSELEKDSPVVAIGWNGDLTVYVIIGSANVPRRRTACPRW